jgi:hypothetical protein
MDFQNLADFLKNQDGLRNLDGFRKKTGDLLNWIFFRNWTVFSKRLNGLGELVFPEKALTDLGIRSRENFPRLKLTVP